MVRARCRLTPRRSERWPGGEIGAAKPRRPGTVSGPVGSDRWQSSSPSTQDRTERSPMSVEKSSPAIIDSKIPLGMVMQSIASTPGTS